LNKMAAEVHADFVSVYQQMELSIVTRYSKQRGKETRKGEKRRKRGEKARKRERGRIVKRASDREERRKKENNLFLISFSLLSGPSELRERRCSSRYRSSSTRPRLDKRSVHSSAHRGLSSSGRGRLLSLSSLGGDRGKAECVAVFCCCAEYEGEERDKREETKEKERRGKREEKRREKCEIKRKYHVF
jgi:hypothetical protein